MMLPRIFGLAVGVFVTWMVFFGAGYFGGVWKHYFADEPQKNTGEVSVKVLPNPTAGMGLCDPHTRQCSTASSDAAPKPHE
jgi:hypothetical protein